MKIDFVLPWVNPNDKKWQEKRAKYFKDRDNNISNSEARYRDMETLRYVLRSIEMNCPWYHKIYLITDEQYPEWIDTKSSRISIISHKEIFFDKDALPVFNSSAIEMNILNIPGLSDNFIYLNDDTIIMRPISQERFFINNLPVDFFCNSFIPRNKIFEILRPGDAWYYSIKNNLKLVQDKLSYTSLDNNMLYNTTYSLSEKLGNFLMKNIYKEIFWIKHWHHPIAYNKNTLKECYDNFNIPMLECSRNKFRKNNDLTQYLYRYWQLLSGKFYPYKHNDDLKIMNISSLDDLEKMIKMLDNNHNIKFVCFNDGPSLTYGEYINVKERLLTYLENNFPNKATFEI